MENFGSAIFGLAKLKKKVTQETTERKKKKMRMMVCLVELFSVPPLTTCNLIFGFETCLTKLPHQWAKKWKNSAINIVCLKCTNQIKTGFEAVQFDFFFKNIDFSL